MSCLKMFLITRLLLFTQILTFVFAASELGSKYEEIGFGVRSTISVPGVFFLALPPHSSPSGSPVPTTISINTRLATNKTSNRINFVAIHGRNSETWSLSSSSDTSVTLCIGPEAIATSIVIIAQVEGESSLNSYSGSDDVTILVDKLDRELFFGKDRALTALIGESSPLTLLVNHVTRPEASFRDHFMLTVEDNSNQTFNNCVVVTVQNRECPLKNRPDNVETAEMYATMLSTATLTIRTDRAKFIEPFYVSVVVLPNDVPCRRLPGDDFSKKGPPKHMTEMSGNRVKNVKIWIEKAPDYSTYVTPIGMAILGMVGVIIISAAVLMAKTYEKSDDSEHFAPEMSQCSPRDDNGYKKTSEIINPNGDDGFQKTSEIIDADGEDPPGVDSTDAVNGSPTNACSDNLAVRYRPQDTDDIEQCGIEFLPDGSDEPDGVACLSLNDVAFKLSQECRKVIASRPRERRIRIKKGLNRLREDATLKDMASILNEDVWFRRNRSRVYLYLIPIVSIFYFVPAIQFAFLAKQSEDTTGSQDLCFHNFKCAKPLNMFSDFNHVVSNMSYWVFGCAFVILVYVKSIRLPEHHHPKNDHRTNSGILQQLSIFYAMGFALIFQGFFSICYHVCPTNLSLQFDTTMMYIICLLCYIKIYQFRHPDATPNAYSVFMFLGVLVLLEALALYSTSWLVFGLFLIFYVIMTIFIAFDCYYIGIGRLDRKVAWILAKDIVSNWRPAIKEGRRFNLTWIRYPWRFFFAAVFCVVNMMFAAITIHSKMLNNRKSVTHVVLTILAGNMMLYLLYYVVRKNFIGSAKSCCRKKSDSEDGKTRCNICTRRISFYGLRFPIPLSAGTFFSVTAFFFGGIALYFYYDRTANRNLSPAESRNLNGDCKLMDFYDGHDLWHFFSAAGIFMAFLALLTVDDDLLDVPRSNIEVF